ncbi:MAG: 3-deoxy-7-phosphoheptulonate synthase [Myxococcota bacterium]
MFVTLDERVDPAEAQSELQALGVWPTAHQDESGRIVGFALAAHSAGVSIERLGAVNGVRQVLAPQSKHPLLDARANRPVEVAGLRIGDGPPVLMAGPCSVESEEQIRVAAAMVAAAGARVLRGGAFKPRSSPYAFAGHGALALGWMRRAADSHGLAVVTEVMSEADVDLVAEHADLLQVGSRNMQSFALLRAVGAAGMPVLLKRGFAARIEEWLLAGEYLLDAGAAGVIFCERGVRGVDPQTRNVIDIAAAALLKHVHGLPVVVDPSHAVGRRDLIPVIGRAALAAGVDGLLVEAHPDPAAALSDAAQALGPDELATLSFVPVPEDRNRARIRYRQPPFWS